MSSVLAASDVQRRLGLSDGMIRWLEGVARPEAARTPVLPDDDQAAEALERLNVGAIDRAETLTARPDPAAHPEYWWVFERVYRDMMANMGRGETGDGFGGWPVFPAGTDALGRFLYVWVFLAVLPDVRAFHAARGIADDASWESLGTLGRAMELHRAAHGVGGLGLSGQWGLPLRFRGANYELGRLGFNRGEISFLGRPRSYVLNVHIPPVGPLDAAACDAAFARARAFFAKHFPDEPVSFFLCHSWLMDDQLARYLPETSNLLQFQRRFQLVPEQSPPVSDRDILHYVFGVDYDGPVIPDTMLDTLPQDTSLRRAFVAHLRAGDRWHARTGWLAF